jgi:hypothetical protein
VSRALGSGLSGLSGLALCRAGARVVALTARAPVFQTGRLAAVGRDGYTWTQADNPLVDQFGQVLVYAQKQGGNIYAATSPDRGATWTDPTLTGWQNAGPPPTEVGTRCALAYNPVLDRVYELFKLDGAPTDALVYCRACDVVRGVGNAVAGLTKVASMNAVLDVQHAGEPGAAAQHPALLWRQDDVVAEPYGKLVATWGINEDTGTAVSASVRGAMRVLTNTAADGDPANWTGLRGETVVAASSGQTPNCPATEIYYRAPGHHNPYNAYPTVLALPSGDLVLAWTTTGERLRYRRLAYDAVHRDWRGALSAVADGPLLVRAGASQSALGYDLRHELVAGLTRDPATGRLFVGFAEWAGDTAGDAWSVAALDGDAWVSQTPTLVYAAGAGLCDPTNFVTGDAWWRGGMLLVPYTTLLGHDVELVALDASGAVLAGPVLLGDHAVVGPFDIPGILRHDWGDGEVDVLGRNFNAGAAADPPVFSGGPYAGVTLGATVVG